ncbi:G2/M phase-specific E3 ubiquitin-protein ligase isoform X2 [Vanacampus margaritifer]
MKKKVRRSPEVLPGSKMVVQPCVLCRSCEDDPALFGDKISLQEDRISVHYFCLLTSCGVYQRGKDSDGVLGFLVDDIKQEIRRSARLTCWACKKKGACVGCNVKSCRKTVHFPCGRNKGFVSQFTENFPSYCPDHRPSQSACASSNLSRPQSCSVCLDAIDGDLSYGVLKCPSCHASWFHRDCVQRQAHSAGLFFFRCTLCNNKDEYQQEMLRMGICIPESSQQHDDRQANPKQDNTSPCRPSTSAAVVVVQRCIMGVGGRRLQRAAGGVQALRRPRLRLQQRTRALRQDRVVCGGPMPAVRIQRDAQEVLGTRGGRRRLGLSRMCHVHGQKSLPGCVSSGDPEEEESGVQASSPRGALARRLQKAVVGVSRGASRPRCPATLPRCAAALNC